MEQNDKYLYYKCLIYVNCNQVATGILHAPNNIIRTSNYIGKSNWAINVFPNADAIYDEFKIYQ